ncbi:AbiH family protein [Winogradskyella sp. HB-48]|uniref:AbiH family protein n=1 Tax=Winogradskyella sp. HB-48 TaxID=3416808 RepID=UPI003CEB57FF
MSSYLDMNNLLIIGNGFDLAHNLKTRYTDFINYIIESNINDELQYKDLIKISRSISSLDFFKKAVNGKYHNPFACYNKFFKLLISDNFLDNWCDIEKRYYDVLMNFDICGYDNINQFHEDFEVLKNHLSLYLEKQQVNPTKIESYSYLFKKLINDEKSTILNFNYTNTLSNYSDESSVIKNKKFINIHGQVNNNSNPIIFGFAADDEESRTLINYGNREYMRYIKKQCYKKTNCEDNLRSYLNDTSNINVFIIGHSCGISDKLILNQIFNHENIKSIYVLFYENYEKFFETQVNIDRIMNNDNNFRKLKSFESSTRMPQKDDDNKEHEEFVKFVDKLIKENTKTIII